MFLFQTLFLAITTVTPTTTAVTYRINIFKTLISTRKLQSRVRNGNYCKIIFLSNSML